MASIEVKNAEGAKVSDVELTDAVLASSLTCMQCMR